jgi:hypothetical protein
MINVMLNPESHFEPCPESSSGRQLKGLPNQPDKHIDKNRIFLGILCIFKI